MCHADHRNHSRHGAQHAAPAQPRRRLRCCHTLLLLLMSYSLGIGTCQPLECLHRLSRPTATGRHRSRRRPCDAHRSSPRPAARRGRPRHPRRGGGCRGVRWHPHAARCQGKGRWEGKENEGGTRKTGRRGRREEATFAGEWLSASGFAVCVPRCARDGVGGRDDPSSRWCGDGDDQAAMISQVHTPYPATPTYAHTRSSA
eukprot:366330-Chlamydomonas_euryale.AAC.9